MKSFYVGKMEKKDFIRTESYFLKLKPSGAKKVIEDIGCYKINRYFLFFLMNV